MLAQFFAPPFLICVLPLIGMLWEFGGGAAREMLVPAVGEASTESDGFASEMSETRCLPWSWCFSLSHSY